jgi:hypothetical protein
LLEPPPLLLLLLEEPHALRPIAATASERRTARVCFFITTFHIEKVDKVEETKYVILGETNTRNKIGFS